MTDLRFDRTMSDAEGLMWRLENDPHLSSTFGAVTVLDRAPDFDVFRRRIERATIAIPRLRQRVKSAPANLAPPTWVDDAEFDVDLHVRRVRCPEPGELRDVLDLASLFLADPLDRTRPLWEFLVIEGMSGGRAALAQKMHHTITDGERGVELSLQYFDFERDAPEPSPLRREPARPLDEPVAGAADTMMELIAAGMRIPLGVAQQVGELLADPARIPDASNAASTTLNGIVSQLTDPGAARSPLWTARSLHRRVEPARAPFRETKDAANRLGGTLNTAFLTAAAHAASLYHAEMGAPAESLRASMAVSTRTESSGSNAFSLARLLVPTSEMAIDERFRAIHEATQAARAASQHVSLDALATVAGALPTRLMTRLARQQSQTIDFATSNVKGSRVPAFIAGAKLLEVYPIGPLAGVAFNLTLLSYAGSLDMALNIDTAAVKEPELLVRCLESAFEQLLAI